MDIVDKMWRIMIGREEEEMGTDSGERKEQGQEF
jgi:hypothetical protein